MKSYTAENIRNIALAGHSGDGKTSLAEAMLFKAGATDRLGKVADGNTVCDYDPEEIRRKVSTNFSMAWLEWKNVKVNVLDTPGLFDFAAGFYEGVSAAESVVIPVSARSDIPVGAEKAVKLARKQDKPFAFFVSKMDLEHADFGKTVASLKAAFGPSVCPVAVPIMKGDKAECYVNLLDMKAYTYDATGKAKTADFDKDDPAVAETLAALSELVAETDEALLDKYLSGETFTYEEMSKAVAAGMGGGSIAPVFAGSTATLEGVDLLLDAVTGFFPSAKAFAGRTARDNADKDVEIACDESKPLAAYVFKTIADPFVGKMSFIKVISGSVAAGATVTNASGGTERIGKLVVVRGKKTEDIDKAVAGDIAVITKLGEVKTGDTLCDASRVVRFQPIEFLKPTLSMALKPKTKGDEGKIASAINRLREEDPTISYEQNAETHQQVISGLGEQHLDMIRAKMKSKFGVDVDLFPPMVPYRETIRKKVKVEGKHKKQSGGHGQFGHVWIEFEPCEGDEMVFAENVFGGSVPRNFFPAVEKGLRDCTKRGVLAGYPVVGLKATLVDGSYHPVDSSEMSFKIAAALAYKAGLAQASPALLEPIGNLKVYVNDTYTGDVMGDLNKRRGRVLGMNPTDEGQEIVAEVPMSEMTDFTISLGAMTQGRGSFVLAFERYELLPSQFEAEVIEKAKQLLEPDEAIDN